MARRETERERLQRKAIAHSFQEKHGGQSKRHGSFIKAEAVRANTPDDQLPGAHGGKAIRESRTKKAWIGHPSRFYATPSRADVEMSPLSASTPEPAPGGFPVILDTNVIVHGVGGDRIPVCNQVVRLVEGGTLRLFALPAIMEEVLGSMESSMSPGSKLAHLRITESDIERVDMLFEHANMKPHRFLEIEPLKTDPSDTVFLHALRLFRKQFPDIRLITRDGEHILRQRDETLPLAEQPILHPDELLQVLGELGLIPLTDLQA